MSNLVNELARFVVDTKFEDLPGAVIQEAKRSLLDSIGCALASLSTEKGKMCAALARRLGGQPESSIIGVGDKVSCSSAALANGELINAMDYDALLSPGGHVSPNVIPAPLAMAEVVGASGKDLILATALGHEIACRVTLALSPMFQIIQESHEKQTIKWTLPYGCARYNFGAAAGAGRLLKLDHDKMANALGLAGHHCQVPTHSKFSTTLPSAMTKYGTAGWQSTGAIIAVLLADMGYLGDVDVFDGEAGFWKLTGSEKWEPEKMMESIGEKWYFQEHQYKPYPCCRAAHTGLDLFIALINQNNLMPDEIERVEAWGRPYGERASCESDQIGSMIDSQFSVGYIFAVAAHRVRIGVEWQDPETLKDPRILGFMKKVTYHAHPLYTQPLKDKDKLIGPGIVEVVARGQTFRAEAMYSRGTPRPGFDLSDQELAEKFRHNASRILTVNKTDAAIKALLNLEKVEIVSEVMKQVTV